MVVGGGLHDRGRPQRQHALLELAASVYLSRSEIACRDAGRSASLVCYLSLRRGGFPPRFMKAMRGISALRLASGRNEEPSAAIIDSQTLRLSSESGLPAAGRVRWSQTQARLETAHGSRYAGPSSGVACHPSQR
jgi:hypothetical protein